MDFLTNVPFKFLLPLILLGIQFSLKLFIDRRATAFNFTTSILEVPINIFFISLALLSALIISGSGDIQKAFILSLLLLPALIISIFLWRRSVEHFENKRFFLSSVLGILNYVLALPTIVYVIYFLMNPSK
jgi:hypothetical protein